MRRAGRPPIVFSEGTIGRSDRGAAAQTMELYQLKTFVVVAREGNLSRAAVKLFTSQPAISAQVKALEESWGVKLFERTPRGMVLTRSGESLLAQAESTLAAAEGVLQQARVLSGNMQGTLRLGTIVDPLALRLGRCLALLATRHPALKIELTQGVSGTIAQGVLKSELDAGYVIGPIDEPLQRETLAPVRLVVAAPPAWKKTLAGEPWTAVSALPWVGTPAHCSFNRLSRELFQRMGAAPQEILRADQESTLLGLVSSGAGISLLREAQARTAAAAGECFVWEGAAVDTDLALVYRRERQDDPVVSALRAAVTETWKDDVA